MYHATKRATAGLDGRARLVAEVAHQGRDVGVRRWYVAGLHRQQIAHRLAAQILLDQFDEAVNCTGHPAPML